MESILYLANLCKYSYRGIARDNYDFSDARPVECGSSKMLVMRRRRVLLFCVTGTDSLEDWVLDADMTMVDLEVNERRLGKVHRGFLTYILKLWPAICEEIQTYIDDYEFANCSSGEASSQASTPLHTLERTDSIDTICSYKIRIGPRKIFKMQHFNASLIDSRSEDKPMVIFTGHSLGSCCAIAALMALFTFPNKLKIRCITFASPKLGNKEWVTAYTQNIARNFRIVHNHDIVTMLPLGRKYKHVNDEVRLGSNGRYLLRHRNLLWLLGKTVCCFLPLKCVKHSLQERLIKDHMIDKYIDAIKETLSTGERANSALSSFRASMAIGSIERQVQRTPTTTPAIHFANITTKKLSLDSTSSPPAEGASRPSISDNGIILSKI